MICRDTSIRRALRSKQRGFIIDPYRFGASSGYLSPFYPTTLYSMRKRNSAYAGNCIRVRNGTTNVETDIGFDADGWCDAAALNTASGGTANLYVKTWYDQSGSGVDATNATTSTQPIIAATGSIYSMAGKPVIRFTSATSANLSVAANAAFGYGTGAFTWEVFARTSSPVSNPGANNVLINQRASFTGADPAQLYISDSTATKVSWYYGSNIASTTSPSVNTDYHFAASYVGGASSALRVFLAGTTVINSNITMNFGATDELHIGTDTTGGFTGYIGEVAITKGTCKWTADFTPRSYS